eukprot:760593-Hanusia_phi.AAC.10
MRCAVLFACVVGASAYLGSPLLPRPATLARNSVSVSAVSPRLNLRVARNGRVSGHVNGKTALRMQTATGIDTAALTRAANEARGLAMDSIAAAKSGHLGLPLGCAEASRDIVLESRLTNSKSDWSGLVL